MSLFARVPACIRAHFAHTAHFLNPRPYASHDYEFFRNRAELHDLCYNLGESEAHDLDALKKIPALVKALAPASLEGLEQQEKLRVLRNDPERAWAFKVVGALGRYINSGVPTDRTKEAAKIAIRVIADQSGNAVLKSQIGLLTNEP